MAATAKEVRENVGSPRLIECTHGREKERMVPKRDAGSTLSTRYTGREISKRHYPGRPDSNTNYMVEKRSERGEKAEFIIGQDLGSSQPDPKINRAQSSTQGKKTFPVSCDKSCKELSSVTSADLSP